jgi:hypothetical protein
MSGIFMNLALIAALIIVLILFVSFLTKATAYIESAIKKNNKTNSPPLQKEAETFKMGMLNGFSAFAICVYKMFEESNGLLVVSSFQEIQAEVNKNVDLFMNNKEAYDTWNKKYCDFLEKLKKENS